MAGHESPRFVTRVPTSRNEPVFASPGVASSVSSLLASSSRDASSPRSSAGQVAPGATHTLALQQVQPSEQGHERPASDTAPAHATSAIESANERLVTRLIMMEERSTRDELDESK